MCPATTLVAQRHVALGHITLQDVYLGQYNKLKIILNTYWGYSNACIRAEKSKKKIKKSHFLRLLSFAWCWDKIKLRNDIADLQISNSNQSNQNLERHYIWGVVWLVVRLYAMFRTRTNMSQTRPDQFL